MTLRYYANAPATTLGASCSNSASSLQVASVTGFPIQYPYTLIIDRDTASEEAVSVTSASGTTLNVTRAIDGTTAFAHTLGATVEHGVTAQDIREANAHVNASTAVHGLSGAVVGTTDAQVVTNKDLTSGTNTFPTALATLTGAQALTNKTIALGSNTVSGTRAQFNTAMTDDDFASLTGTETLTNKTVDLASNTLTGTTAQFNTALSDNDFATLAGTETLTNKTLDTGTKVGAGTTDISAAWTAYTPTAANFTVGNGTLTGRYIQIGKIIIVRITFTAGSTSSYTASAATVTLPFGAHATGGQSLSAIMNNNVAGIGLVGAGTSTCTPLFSASASNPLLVGINTGNFTPGTTGNFVVEGIYEAA